MYINSHIPYLLTTTYPMRSINTDIPTGWFRQINLRLPPFSFENCLEVIDDWVEGCPVRQLLLWRHDDVKAALLSNKWYRRLVG